MKTVCKRARLPVLLLAALIFVSALTPFRCAWAATLDDALLDAALKGDLREVRELMARGASSNAHDSIGREPLHNAALICDRAVAGLLIKNGAKVNAKDSNGDTPLDLAADASPAPAGMLEFIRFLLAKGADVNSRSKTGGTPLHTAALGGKADVVALLIKRGAIVNARDNDGVTPLALAAEGRYGDYEAARVLLAKGADVNARDKDGFTPLLRAAQAGSDKIVRLFLAKGARVNASNSDGETALHLASIWGFTDIARVLIEKRADVMAKDADGMTPWDRAVRNRNVEIAALLKKAMASRGGSNGAVVAALAPKARDPFQKGLSAAGQAQWPKAIEYFLKAQEIDPIAPQIWFNLGFAESNIPDHELRALAWFKAYLSKVPEAPNRDEVQAEMDDLGHRLEQRYLSIFDAVTDFLKREKGKSGVSVDETIIRIARAEIDFGRVEAGVALLDSHFAKALASGMEDSSLDFEISRLMDALAWAGLDDEAEKYNKLLRPEDREISPVRMFLMLDDGKADAFMQLYEAGPPRMAGNLWRGATCIALEQDDKALLKRLAQAAEASTDPGIRADLVGLLAATGRTGMPETQKIVKELAAAEPGPLWAPGTLNKSLAVSFVNGTNKLCEGDSYTKEGRFNTLLFLGKNGVTIDNGQGPAFDERFVAGYVEKIKEKVQQRTTGLASDRGVYDMLRMVDRLASVADAYREIRGRFDSHARQ